MSNTSTVHSFSVPVSKCKFFRFISGNKRPFFRPTQEKPDPLLDHAAKIAYRTISTIFDDESEDCLSRVQSTESLKSLSICDEKWPVKAVSNPVWTTDSW